LIVSFPPSLAVLEAELDVAAAQHGKMIVVEGILAEGALAALQRGEPQEHDRLVAAAVNRLSSIDGILGQFSLSRARAAVQQICDLPVLTTPHCAVVALRDRISRAK
jgi:hypothetical protein